MRYVLVASVSLLVLAGCSTTEWVNLNNPQAEYGQDYNQCETAGYQNPKVQGGMKLILQQSIDRCMAKKGWILREKR